MVSIDNGRATRVELTVGYTLSGPLAQIVRDGLVRDLASRITTAFAQNCNHHMSGATRPATSEQQQRLNALTLLLDVARARLAVLARRMRQH
jgi:carbon-monoxide dehydrogenase small subunit